MRAVFLAVLGVMVTANPGWSQVTKPAPAAPAPAPLSAEAQALSKLSVARNLLKSGETEKAIPWLEEAIKLAPGTPTALEAERLLKEARAQQETAAESEAIDLGWGPAASKPAALVPRARETGNSPPRATTAGTSVPRVAAPKASGSPGTGWSKGYTDSLKAAARKRKARSVTTATPPADMGSLPLPGLFPFPMGGGGGGTVHVRGYYRSNGTYVAPYTRSAPRR